MKRTFQTVLLALAVTSLSAASNAQVFVADLSGLNESPPNASPGTGLATVTLDALAHTLRVEITFSGLLGTTTASHIHSATAVPGTGNAGVATTTPTFAGFPLGVTSGTYDNTLDLTASSSYNPAFITANGGTTSGAEAALIAGITGGKAYLNIHTSVVPSGEIRGFLVQAVPEPGIMAMAVGLGVGTVLLIRRRRIA